MCCLYLHAQLAQVIVMHTYKGEEGREGREDREVYPSSFIMPKHPLKFTYMIMTVFVMTSYLVML